MTGGNVSKSSKPDEPPVVPLWGTPSRSNKHHLFVEARSLCMRWGFMNGEPDQPWTGNVGAKDCAACVKVAKKHYPKEPQP